MEHDGEFECLDQDGHDCSESCLSEEIEDYDEEFCGIYKITEITKKDIGLLAINDKNQLTREVSYASIEGDYHNFKESEFNVGDIVWASVWSESDPHDLREIVIYNKEKKYRIGFSGVHCPDADTLTGGLFQDENSWDPSGKKPSEEYENQWISQKNETNQKDATENSGKWLLFDNVSNLDNLWMKIRDATKKGTLGTGAKTSTMKPSLRAKDENIKVICVYTYNSEDINDICRIAWELFKMGIKFKNLSYKEDKETIDGNYGYRASKYSLGSKCFDGFKNLEDLKSYFKDKYPK